MLRSFIDRLAEITNLRVLTMPSFGLFQMLDVLIVAVVLYLILRWIRRTQAWVLVKGIVFIAFIAILAEVFNLSTVQWVARHTLAMGFVIVVVLFQPELRKALEQLGRGKYLFPIKIEAEQKIHSATHTVDEIIKAARIMSDSLTGALIVLEQEVDLNEHAAKGVKLDAQVSMQLLLNIFEKNAPLHDGAVIIRQNRIYAASCILPLTAEHVEASLGTRHRAAIGVSEVSDARVIVVSEETGLISLAINGQILRDVNEKQIRDLLLWGEPVKTRFSLFKRRKS